MHGEEDCIFSAQPRVVDRRLRIHVDNDVGGRGGVVPERECVILVEQCGYGLEIKKVTK